MLSCARIASAANGQIPSATHPRAGGETTRRRRKGLRDSPEAMKAIVQTGYGPPERVLRMQEIEPPALKADDVLVRVRATSVNTPDWITVAGVPYILRPAFGLRGPRTPVRGTDVAGVVEAVGPDVTDLRPGDEVFGSSWTGTLSTRGTFAELTALPASGLFAKPAGLTFEEAGASVMSGLTALAAMQTLGSVSPGMRVLINGASGGVGTFAVQIAASLGAEVTGVCSTRNLDLVRSLGAARVIDYTHEDFTRGTDRYDLILDNVLNHSPSATAGVLAPGGVLMPNSVGNTGGLFAGLPRMARAALLRLGSTNVRFVSWKVGQENLRSLATLLENRDVRAVISETYPLADAARAVSRMLGHHAVGNVAITV
jgi:NADPH:quinone reductase-like Zn-dependent oxidoreductase